MYSLPSFKTQIRNLFSRSFLNAQHPPEYIEEDTILFPKEIPISLISLSQNSSAEISGLDDGFAGRALGWTKTPSRWILLSKWVKSDCTLHIDLIYGLDSWKVKE